MSAGAWRTAALAAGILAAAGAGWWGWRAHGEAEDRAALLAEVRAHMAAGPSSRAFSADEPSDAAASKEYGAVFALFDPRVIDQGFSRGLAKADSWGEPPPEVSKVLDAHAELFRRLARVAEGAGRRSIETRLPLPYFHGTLGSLLYARGRAEIARGDAAGAVATARLVKAVVRDLSTAAATDFRSIFLANLERRALDLLKVLIRRPGVDAEALAAALEVAKEPWAAAGLHDRWNDYVETLVDGASVELLGPRAEKWMRDQSMGPPTLQESVTGLFRGSVPKSRGPERPPSAAALRRMRETEAAFFRAVRSRDGSAFVLNGPLDRAFFVDAGGGWQAYRLGAGADPGRWEWTSETEIELLRSALALRLLEVRSGRPPAGLEEAVPTLLDGVPVDAWTGKPVVVELRPDGWTVTAGPPPLTRVLPDGTKETENPVRIEWKRPGK
jgi:hypothetical protein